MFAEALLLSPAARNFSLLVRVFFLKIIIIIADSNVSSGGFKTWHFASCQQMHGKTWKVVKWTLRGTREAGTSSLIDGVSRLEFWWVGMWIQEYATGELDNN